MPTAAEFDLGAVLVQVNVDADSLLREALKPMMGALAEARKERDEAIAKAKELSAEVKAMRLKNLERYTEGFLEGRLECIRLLREGGWGSAA